MGFAPNLDILFNGGVAVNGGREIIYPNGSANTTNSDPELAQSEPSPSLSEYMTNNPDATPQEAMEYMSQHSDEWAEKYLDYLTEKGELTSANEYTAEREDTAYQRLVNDLRQAGLNPAMMYGGSANISASGSQGYVKMTEGANSRSIGNYAKLKKVILDYMLYELKKNLGTANSVMKGIGVFGQILGALL
jgi:hypothetical protein